MILDNIKGAYILSFEQDCMEMMNTGRKGNRMKAKEKSRQLNRQIGVVDKHDQMFACLPIMRKFLQELEEDILSYDGRCPFI
jgi:hypothetical protein